eukprot:5884523-Amphidinium_carterae.1
MEVVHQSLKFLRMPDLSAMTCKRGRQPNCQWQNVTLRVFAEFNYCCCCGDCVSFARGWTLLVEPAVSHRFPLIWPGGQRVSVILVLRVPRTARASDIGTSHLRFILVRCDSQRVRLWGGYFPTQKQRSQPQEQFASHRYFG